MFGWIPAVGSREPGSIGRDGELKSGKLSKVTTEGKRETIGCALWPRKSSAELRLRALQEFRKRADLIRCLLGSGHARHRGLRQDVSPGRFFFAARELSEISQFLAERLPEAVLQIVEQAEKICQHRFDLLGYEDLKLGSQIDWHLDIVHQKRAPLRPWYKVHYLDFRQVGDHKIIWELNRHQHLVTLAKAYQLTRSKQFAGELVRQWYDWQESNPYPLGINWASSLEVAFRSLAWLWVRHLLPDDSVECPSFSIDLLRGLETSGRHIERFLSTYFSPNTHLLGEGVALFFIGIICPELAAAERWKQLGWQIILREAVRQVQQDGMHFEQSACYHVYALDFFLHSRILAARNGIPVPVSFDRTIERMLEALMLLAQAGSVPGFGDDDGGRVFDSRRNRVEHLTDPLSTGAVLLNRPEFKAAAGCLCEETVWLMGAKGAAQFDRLPACALPTTSARLESSGLCAMVDSGGRREKLVIDAGPLGHGHAGHGHADALSLVLSINGRQWLTDSGTGGYVSDSEDRERFRGTGAHNTLQVDGLDQARPAGPFAWKNLPQVKIDRWVAGKTFDYFSGRHNGYCRLPSPVTHRRRVFYLRDRFWLVHDTAAGEGNHHLALNWHLRHCMTSTWSSPHARVFSAEDGQGLAFLTVQGQTWRSEIESAEISPAYGLREPSLALRYFTETSLPAEFVTFMLPRQTAHWGERNLGALTLTDPETKGKPVSGYLYERPGERHSFFLADGPLCWTLGSWESDAEVLYYGTSAARRFHLVLCNGSFVRWNGRDLLACQDRMERWELLASDAGREEFCSNEAVPRTVYVNVLSGIGLLHEGVVLSKEAH